MIPVPKMKRSMLRELAQAAHVEAWARRYAEKHPELFIPRVSEASEGDDHTEAMGAQRHLSFLDYNEPLALEKHLEHLEKFFETGRNPGPFYRTPTLTHIFEVASRLRRASSAGAKSDEKKKRREKKKRTGIFHMGLAPARTWTVELFGRPLESPVDFDSSSYDLPGEGHSQRMKESANMGSQFVDAFIRWGGFRRTAWA